jgi:hypothetical protein
MIASAKKAVPAARGGWSTRWVRRLAEISERGLDGQPPSCCEGETSVPAEPTGSGPTFPTWGSGHRVRRLAPKHDHRSPRSRDHRSPD